MSNIILDTGNFLYWLKRYVFDNAEVLSTLFALIALAARPKQPKYLRPIIIYLWFALLFYSLGNIMADFSYLLPGWFYKLIPTNNILYNIHSLVRFTCFAFFFKNLNQPYYKSVRKILPLVSLIFIIIFFGLLKNNFFYDQRFNSKLLTVEAYLLLIYCMLFYLSSLKLEVEDLRKRKDFWIVTGLSSYVVINFFVFLFYDPAFDYNSGFANRLWDIHNVAQIFFCTLIAKAFYVPAEN